MLIASLLVRIIKPKETLHFVIEVIDFNTIGLLLGMMIIVAVLGETGILTGSVRRLYDYPRVIYGN